MKMNVLSIFATLSAAIAIALSFGALIGWFFTNALFLTHYLPSSIMMAPSSAICFILSSLLLLLLHGNVIKKNMVLPGYALTMILGLYAMGVIFDTIFNFGFSIEQFFALPSGEFSGFPIARMSPFTAGLFCLIAVILSLLMHNLHTQKKVLVETATIWSLVVLGSSILVILSYVYQVPILYTSKYIPMAFPTALAFFFLSIGLILHIGPRSEIVDAVVGTSLRSGLLRAYLPIVVIALFVQGWCILFSHENPAVLTVITTFGITSIVIVLVAIQSRHISRQLNSAAQLLEQEKMRLAITLRSIGDGVIATDTHGIITGINKAAAALTGWDMEDAVGKPLSEVFVVVDEHTRLSGVNPVNKVLATGVISDLTNHACLLSKTGQEFSIANSGAPIRDNNDTIIGVVLVFKNVTDKRKLDEALQQAHKMDSIGTLAGGIAHDFNNLLGGIFGYLDMAVFTNNQHRQDLTKINLEKALGVFERAKALTTQLLTFARGGAPLRSPQHLEPIISASTQFALSGSNVSYKLTIDPDLKICNCDKNQIGQVIDNLIINAKQAMPEGGTIWVTAENSMIQPHQTPLENVSGPFIKISIKDEGIGIPPEHIQRLFDPFFSTKDSGHGLGLATAFSIIKHHDGWIEVESTQGKGSTFYIFLPASDQTHVTASVVTQTNHQGSGTILVMDDEAFMRDIFQEVLEKLGYDVVTAKNGQDACYLFEQAQAEGKPFVLCILDLTIPGGMSGRNAAATILSDYPDAVIIASSGYSQDPIMANPGEYGFCDKIIKPFRKQDVINAIQHCLGTRKCAVNSAENTINNTNLT